jgi:lipopolysaccharide transport system permease protein
LLWTLAYRDFKVKYAQTLLGVIWAIIEPLFTAILLSFVFNKVADAKTYGVNPILFGLTGVIAWNYFANVVNQGTTSLILAQNMVKKIYFPKILLPASKALAALPDMIITVIFTIIYYLIYWNQYNLQILFFPIFLILTILSATSLGIWFSALNIRYRDFRHVVPFVIRIGLFVTPIAYTTLEIPDKYRWIFFLNPMTGVIEGLRWSLFGLEMQWNYFYISLIVIIVLFTSGFYFFNKMEKNIADII